MRSRTSAAMTSTDPENVGGGAGVVGLPGTVGAAVGTVAGRVPRVTGGAALGPGTAQPAAIVAATGTARPETMSQSPARTIGV